MKTADVIIAGAGAAGLFTAIRLAPHKQVILLSGTTLGGESSSMRAQGGIAAAVGKDDSAFAHTKDTLKAGDGLSELSVTESITQAAPDAIAELGSLGVAFERDTQGNYRLNREACHATRRVLRAEAGDGFGKELMRALIHAAGTHPNICIVENVEAERLLHHQGTVYGVAGRETRTGESLLYTAPAVVLATGGAGGLYTHTTNPLTSVGRGIAIAARAGAVLADLEFVQFHPTALDIGEDPAPLATEALRGEGALLLNSKGERFMQSYHAEAELAPRDVVSRGVFAQQQLGNRVFLDCRRIARDEFPALLAACARGGIDPATELVPITPAAHYHMGGIATDLDGKTSLCGLWACGEVASTGLHGANRLASNSLIEAIVMGGRVAANILSAPAETVALPPASLPATEATRTVMREEREHLREVMTKFCGVIRSKNTLMDGLSILGNLEQHAKGKDLRLEDMAMTARMIVVSALLREESRGGHFRSDFPHAEAAWQKRSFTTLEQINRYVVETRKTMEYVA